MKDDIKEIYLSNLEWTKTHDNMGGVMGNLIFKDNMSYDDYQKLFKTTYFILCNKDYITNLQTIEQEYNALLSENAELENKITDLQEELYSTNQVVNELLDERDRNKKAVEYIKFTSNLKYENEYVGLFIKDVCNNLLNILGGDE